MRTVVLPYGRDRQISFALPEQNLAAVLSPPDVPPVADLRSEIRRALQEPFGARPLREAVRGCGNVTVLADDNTRLTPTEVILPEVLDELNAGGIADSDILVLIALGTHRPMTGDEIVHKFGPEVVSRVRIMNHDYRDRSGLRDLGRTASGTPVLVNRLVCEAGFAVGVGSVYPHHIPGMAGGAKIVQPGVCGEETTGATHLLGCRARPTYLGLVDNPVRRELNAVARLAGVRHIVNAVQNAHGATVSVFYGDTEAAFLAAAETSRQVLSTTVSERADIVVAGSFPADAEWWQAHKTLYPAERAAKDGGTLVVVTPCPEGVAATHAEMLAYTAWDAAEIDDAVSSGRIADAPAAALALAWAHVRKGRQVSLVSSGIAGRQARALGFVPFKSIEDALEDAFRRHGRTASVNVLPRAPETLPLLELD